MCIRDSSNGNDSTVTEVKKEFCGVPPEMMIALIKNYKEQVWSKTSDTAADKHDARYMEISIEQLENFIAYAKQSARKDGVNLAAVRMYYINYPGQKKTDEYLMAHKTGNVFEDYAGCHSIALVPVVGANIHDGGRRDYYSVGPVSYTHLDVYKRQTFTKPSMPLLMAVSGYLTFSIRKF